jgi:hypothetical protein
VLPDVRVRYVSESRRAIIHGSWRRA